MKEARKLVNTFTETVPKAREVMPALRRLIDGSVKVIDARTFGEAIIRDDGVMVLRQGNDFTPVVPGLNEKGEYWIVQTPKKPCMTCGKIRECRFGHCAKCTDDS